jgi:alkylmercury lyase
MGAATGIAYTRTVMKDQTSPRLDHTLSAYIASEKDRFGDAERQTILLALLQLIAEGAPITAPDIARAADVPADTVEAAIADLPASWFETDDDGRLIGFGGLTQNPTRHRLRLGSQTLYAWCAFDCLFLPGLLGRTVDVESACPTTEAPIRLTISPQGTEDRTPRSAVMSFVNPDQAARRQSLRQVFCAHINFFADTVAAGHWLAAAESGQVLDLETADALARQRNDAVFGAVLPA